MDTQETLEQIRTSIEEIKKEKQDRGEIIRLLKNAEERRINNANREYRVKANEILRWLGKDIEQTGRFDNKNTIRVYIDNDLTITTTEIKWKDQVVLTKDSYVAGEWQGRILALYPEAQILAARDELQQVKAKTTEEDNAFGKLLSKAGFTTTPTLPKDYISLNEGVYLSLNENDWHRISDYDLKTDKYLVDQRWHDRSELMTEAEFRQALRKRAEEAEAAMPNDDTAEISIPATETTSTLTLKCEEGGFYGVDIEEIQSLNKQGYEFEIIAAGTSSRFDVWGNPYPVLITLIRVSRVPENQPTA